MKIVDAFLKPIIGVTNHACNIGKKLQIYCEKIIEQRQNLKIKSPEKTCELKLSEEQKKRT